MPTIYESIENSDKVICQTLDSIGSISRGLISQYILSQLRNLVEYVIMLFCFKDGNIDVEYNKITKSIEEVRKNAKLLILSKFHKLLQISVSHYTLAEEPSERLMLKYYAYLIKLKYLLKENFKLDVLHNLENFTMCSDPILEEYYVKIAEKIDIHKITTADNSDKYYIQKIKPFFIKGKAYYEVTFMPANDYNSKSDRVIAFSEIEVTNYYAARLTIVNDVINIFDKEIPILIIVGWEVSIRNCEFKNFVKLFEDKPYRISRSEQRNINSYLSHNRISLVDIIEFSDDKYQKVVALCSKNLKNTPFINVLSRCREIIKFQKPGHNILRYLLLNLNNVIIKRQKGIHRNQYLSNLYLQNKCIPFDNMPFAFALVKHNPRLSELLECIPFIGREHELLARRIKNGIEVKGELFTGINEFENPNNIKELVNKYNKSLWYKHENNSKLVVQYGQIFINGFKESACDIIERLNTLSQSGVQNYISSVEAWLRDNNTGVDCDDKKSILMNMFSESHVAFVYGSAGVGKSTLINHVAQFFSEQKILFLAHTNPAVDNLKRRVNSSNGTFSTVKKYLCNQFMDSRYDLVVIDECSTVSNIDMREILNKTQINLLLLVGDTYQINSIRFGNWFSTAKAFVNKSAIFELLRPYRTSEQSLINLWTRVRTMEDNIEECLTKNNYSIRLDSSIFETSDEDEIILCLNYDGFYGINNINKILQEKNLNPAVEWGVMKYKKGDPVIFNDSERFSPVIYNNLKGKIHDVYICNEHESDEKICFEVEIDKVINGLDVENIDGLELLDGGDNTYSIVKFFVDKNKLYEDEDSDFKTVIPFQVAYALSIHKAQGLEYKSVKIIITEEIDELITHNIFYTAITRARKNLKIYWSPEVERKVLDNIKPKDIRKDVGILRKYLGV